MTFCKVCEVTDLGVHIVTINGIATKTCQNCGSKDSVIERDLDLWLEEIEACND